MPIVDGVYVPLTFEDALELVINAAPATIQFAPGNPPELILANMFAQAEVIGDHENGAILAALMSPVGAMIDMLNPNNPRCGIITTTGYLQLENFTGAIISVPAGTIFTASSGQTYSIGNGTVDVPAAIDEYTPGVAYCTVTAVEAGSGGNIPANRTFTASGLDLTVINPLPWLNGAERESDALYLNRTIQEKTEAGSQVASVAAETEIKKYYSAARMYINKSTAGSTDPIPLPGNGYNLVVRNPNGPLAPALEIQTIFDVLSRRFEFVNSQNLGTDTHPVLGGTVYVSGVPQLYFFTPAQAVDFQLNVVINVRFASFTKDSEKITQANDFATYFIRRLMAFFSGVSGSTTVTFNGLDEYESPLPPVETEIELSADIGQTDPIAPIFGIAQVRDLVSDLNTKKNTPQLFYDSAPVCTLILDPNVEGEDPVLMSLEEYDRQFIDFQKDVLFTDDTSWFDRYTFINPENITVTVQEIPL